MGSPYVTYDLFDKVWIVVPSTAVPGQTTQAVVQFSPGLNVSATSIIIPANYPLPNVSNPGSVWTAPPSFWIAMVNTTLPASLIDGQGTDQIKYSRGPALPPGSQT